MKSKGKCNSKGFFEKWERDTDKLSWEKKYYLACMFGSMEAIIKYMALTCLCWMVYLMAFQVDNSRYDILNLLLILSGLFAGLGIMTIGDCVKYTLKFKGVKK